MATKMIIAAVMAFLFTAVFGRVYVPWLKNHGAAQPLKEEVAKIYEERENSEKAGE